MRRLLIATLLALTTPLALSATQTPKDDVQQQDVPLPPGGMNQALPEIKGVVSWKTLAQVEPVKRDGKMIPSFSSQILALDSQLVRINGFMMPLDMTDQQKHFLISAVPSSCPFCMPAGPEAIVEVTSKTPIKFGLEPIIVAGKFVVLKNDQSGLLYRMTDAELVNTSVK